MCTALPLTPRSPEEKRQMKLLSVVLCRKCCCRVCLLLVLVSCNHAKKEDHVNVGV